MTPSWSQVPYWEAYEAPAESAEPPGWHRRQVALALAVTLLVIGSVLVVIYTRSGYG